MRMDTVRSVLIYARALPTGIGFNVVVVVARDRLEAADIQQVHFTAASGAALYPAPLCGCAHKDVDDALVGYDIGIADRSRITGIEDRAFGSMHFNGSICTTQVGRSGSITALAT